MEPVNNNPAQPSPVTPQPAAQAPTPVPPAQKKKGKLGLIISLLIILLLLCVSGAAGYTIYKNLNADETGQTACTMEAMLCPDGTSVGRSGPNCEFAPCPTESQKQSPTPTLSPINTSDWKIFSDPQSGFSVSYPPDWSFDKKSSEIIFGPISTINHIGADVEPYVTSAVVFQSFSTKPGSELEDYLTLLNLRDPVSSDTIETEKIEVDGYNTYFIKHTSCVSGGCKTIIIEKGAEIYVFHGQGDANELLNGFLPTFKFTE